MLDLNIFNKVIDDDIESFDVVQAAEIMRTLNHKWYIGTDCDDASINDTENYIVPTSIDVYKELRKRLIKNYERLIAEGMEYVYSSSGGYRIESHYSAENGYWSAIMYCPVESIL